jgi:peptidyl-prolyl cis-trans isomerase SurA
MDFRTTGIAIGTAAAVLLLGACGGPGDGAEGPAASEQAGQGQDPAASGEAASATEPDLSDVPDVVAEVNGEEITKDDFAGVYESQFQQQAMQSQQTGQQVDQDQLKQDLITSLVGVELLEQEAAERGIEADDADIDEALEETAEQNQMSPDEFLEAMGQQGLDEDEVRDQVASQTTVSLLVEDEAGPFEASDEEKQEAYDQAVSQQEQMAQQSGQQAQEMPAFEDVEPQLEEQVATQ